MKKILFIISAFVMLMTASCTSTYIANHQDYKNKYRYANYNSGFPGKIVFRKDVLNTRDYGVSKSPNRVMANAVAISGFAAMGARMQQEMTTPPQDLILVVPEGTTTPIIIKEQEPVVKHPVPISPLPIEVLRSK